MTELESRFDAVAIPVIGLDADLTIVSANREARKAFPKIAHGKAIGAAISGKGKFIKLLEKALKTKDEITTSLSLSKGFGKEFQVTLRAVDPGGVTGKTALVLTFEDRSPLRDVKAMRSEFVANVSHEIRSPLTAISGFVETLQGPARDDPKAREMFLGMMGKEVVRMTNLVSDLLSLSKVEVKERRAPKKMTNPNSIIREACESATTYAHKRGKTLAVHIAGSLPAIPGNHGDLVRMLINLMENAVNYSHEGSEITLGAQLMENDRPLGRPAVCISIRDQGEGIAAEEIPRLTERFYRVDKSRSRNVGGTGLGLAIVKHILRRHRGQIEINSVPGEGSEFRVYLPLAKPKKK
ncbi:Phosphate regulon sensor protein PhoR (SphS) [hydrothermal vent metagenome]|uniref:histidine kinase n=1 Tax=hydrothermal vent metagenome TaxID=652676 RepID=A0A3B0SKM9_9ZZZZ